MNHRRGPCICLKIFGDRGYTEERLREDMWEKGICLMFLKPFNYKDNWSKKIWQLIFRSLWRIETVFSQLSE